MRNKKALNWSSQLGHNPAVGCEGPTPHVITSDICTCRKQLPAVSSLQTLPAGRLSLS